MTKDHIIRKGPFYPNATNNGNGFVTLFGYGLWWKDRSRNRLYFSERNWIKPFHFAVGTWHFTFLNRSRVPN